MIAPNDLMKTSLALSWTLTTVAFIAVALSLCAQLKKKETLIDYSLFLSAFVAGLVAVCQMTWAMLNEHIADHANQPSNSQIVRAAKVGFAQGVEIVTNHEQSLIMHEMLWIITSTLIRVGACRLLLKIFSVGRFILFELKLLIALSLVYGITSCLEIILICRPISKDWDPTIEGSCGNQLVSFVAIECLGLALDLAILVAPVRPVLQMKTPTRQKIYILVVLEAGIIVFAASAFRLKLLVLAASTDFTWSKSYLGMVSCVAAMGSVITGATPDLAYLRKTWAKESQCLNTLQSWLSRSVQRLLRNHRHGSVSPKDCKVNDAENPPTADLSGHGVGVLHKRHLDLFQWTAGRSVVIDTHIRFPAKYIPGQADDLLYNVDRSQEGRRQTAWEERKIEAQKDN